jgi:protein TIF31
LTQYIHNNTLTPIFLSPQREEKSFGIINSKGATMTEARNGEDSAIAPPEEETKPKDLSADDKVDPSQQVFKNLLILPPLQKKGGDNELQDAVPLPPIRAEEPVSSIRAALGEIRGYAHLTNYRFVLENTTTGDIENDGKNLSPQNGLSSLASPYTGLNALISTKEVIKSFLDEAKISNATTENPEGAKEGIVLDEFGDLTSLLGNDDTEGLKDGSKFRIVLEQYDIALISNHIARLRTLLDGNAPTSVSLDEGSGEATGSESTSQATTAKETESTNGKGPNAIEAEQSDNQNSEHTPTNTNDEPQKASNSKEKKDTPKLSPKDMPQCPAEESLSPDVNDLKHFFYYACGEDPSYYLDDSDGNKKENGGGSKTKKKGKKKNSKNTSSEDGEKTNGEAESKQQLLKRIIPQLNEIEERTRVSCDIRFSGFHPPPKYRQFMGDLAYLEVTLPDGDLVSISVTAIGFYVNKSSLTRGDYKFDPSPAVKPCFSHELLDCLILYSKSFSDAWNDAVVAAKARAEIMLKINEDGPFQSFFRVAIRGDFPGYKKPSVASASEGIDALVQVPSWLVPIPKVELEANNSWNRNCEHTYSSAKTEGDLSNSFGVDIRNGSLRDWNEELQVAREMPMNNLLERIERARYVDNAHWINVYGILLFLFETDQELLIAWMM